MALKVRFKSRQKTLPYFGFLFHSDEVHAIMKVLIIGGGGREHALAKAVSRNSNLKALYMAPGNPGMAALGEVVDIGADDLEGLLHFAKEKSIDFTIVGPEIPLVMGIVDRFREAGLAILGPTAAAARIEGSKAFAKAFMAQYDIPTAAFRTFEASEYDEAVAYVHEIGAPIVLKASGLAAGKGVLVCMHLDEAVQGVATILKEQAFGEAGETLLIEEYMEGEEASVFALCDGSDYVLLAPAQDHKRIGEGDTGPNTGGMGAYAPAPIMTPERIEQVEREVIQPTLKGMIEEGHPYTGFLYCGLMVTAEGPRVVEFNCRLGDPETQVVLPLLASDPFEVMHASVTGNLQNKTISLHDGAAVCVILASEGYPGSYEKGKTIHGWKDFPEESQDAFLFHAGTKSHPDGSLVTNGGRVMGVTALAPTLRAALDKVYTLTDKVCFDGMQYRRDIGKKGLR